MKIRTILDQIDLGSMALPESRRGYVRDRDQVRGLMQSLYRKRSGCTRPVSRGGSFSNSSKLDEDTTVLGQGASSASGGRSGGWSNCRSRRSAQWVEPNSRPML